MVTNPLVNTEDIRDTGFISGAGKSPGEGNGNPLQNFCLENPLDRGGWQATVHGAAKELDMTEATEHTHLKNLATFMVL